MEASQDVDSRCCSLVPRRKACRDETTGTVVSSPKAWLSRFIQHVKRGSEKEATSCYA